jgi:hypothetical protein
MKKGCFKDTQKEFHKFEVKAFPMKHVFTFLFSASAAVTSFGQLNSPESVAWDAATNRYFVSNNGNNQVLVRSSTGVYTVFTTNISSGPHGLEIVGNTLYACDGSSLKGFDLTTAALVFNLNLGASFLNGICTDGNNSIYVTDFTAKKIYHVLLAQQAFYTFAGGLANTPNGIFYDGPGGRLVWVCWGSNAPIMQAQLSDSTVSQVTATTLGNCDGLVQDGAGNYYVSAWNSNGIFRFNSTFGSPVQVVTGLNSPADIYYNLTNDSLVSPNSGTNTVTFHYMGPQTGMGETGSFPGFSVFPNPCTAGRPLSVSWDQQDDASVELLDARGLLLSYSGYGFNAQACLATNGYAPGIYFVRLSSAMRQEIKKIVILNE